MLRDEAPPDDLLVVLRATPSDVDEAISEIADDAGESANVYVVTIDGRTELLHGVSVFAQRDGVGVNLVLERFAYAPRYCSARVGDLRGAGFEVLPTGANPDHFDVQLIPSRSVDGGPADRVSLLGAARRMVQVAGDLLPNPAYAYNEEES
jgi:hypothetical protein